MDMLLPMLAIAGEPFDSTEHLFEVKWDGIRALASGGSSGKLWGRDQVDYTDRYPELTVRHRWPDGTLVDGELVRLTSSGHPDFGSLLARHQLASLERIHHASRLQPVTYVVFDLLFDQGRSLLSRPLHSRRARLQEFLASFPEARVQFSAGVVGPGKRFFTEVVRQGHEGVMAKHLESRYQPGRRAAAWRKIKPRIVVPGVVVGFTPGRVGPRRLLVATTADGELRYLGAVRFRGDDTTRSALQERLDAHIRSTPVVPCPHPAVWVEPVIAGQVRGVGWTQHGRLRGAHFILHTTRAALLHFQS